ncbi:hypothetical protein NM688_g952 [Phlebia brevispora]|uniref:Uncharacterized protein n=1 Tax=Phlebia brevispora TaxID=194682 RepID=A0ACC1TCV5_9APHY|nr:hypothetical protein NM688_g952 [Phlebia brevispora]
MDELSDRVVADDSGELESLNIESPRKYNAGLPISRLPPEILANIFVECLTVLCWPSDPRATVLRQHRRTLSQVCHHWRDVALSAAILWTYFFVDRFSIFEAVKEQLRRSQKAPLDLCILYPDLELAPSTIDHRPFSMIFRELPRIRTLDLVLRPNDAKLPPWPQAPASSLEELRLSAYPEVLDIEDEAYNEVLEGFVGPADLASLETLSRIDFARRFDTICPVLKSLTINSLSFNFRDWILPSTLTSLKVYYASSPDVPISFDDVMSALRRLPHLTELTLEYALPQNATPGTGVCSPPVLPQLRKLTLVDSLRPSAYLLDGLRGSAASLDVSLVMRTYEELGRYPSLSQVIRSGLRPQTISITLGDEFQRWDDEECIVLKAWKKEYTVAEMHIRPASSTADLKMTFVVDLDESFNADFSSLYKLIEGLPLSSTTTMYLNCVRTPASAFFPLSVFRSMKGLQTLHVVGNGNPYDVLQSWIWLLNQNRGLVFPALRVLYMELFDFQVGFHRFLGALRRRQRLARIEKLILRNCYSPSPEDVRALEDVIAVDWDAQVRRH